MPTRNAQEHQLQLTKKINCVPAGKKVKVVENKIRCLKSDNLQYNTMVRWNKWLVDQASDVPSISFFIISCKFFAKILPIDFFIFFYKFTKIKVKSFECPKSIRNYKKKMLGTSDAWSTSHLCPQTSVLYCRLSDCSSWSSANQEEHCAVL